MSDLQRQAWGEAFRASEGAMRLTGGGQFAMAAGMWDKAADRYAMAGEGYAFHSNHCRTKAAQCREWSKG